MKDSAQFPYFVLFEYDINVIISKDLYVDGCVCIWKLNVFIFVLHLKSKSFKTCSAKNIWIGEMAF